MIRYKRGGDIVSGASKLADKLCLPFKNWHLPGHKCVNKNKFLYYNNTNKCIIKLII